MDHLDFQCAPETFLRGIIVESAVNQVARRKQMVKKQQISWGQQGAQLLLLVRTRVLNDELRDVFRKWYPNFTQEDENQRKAA